MSRRDPPVPAPDDEYIVAEVSKNWDRDTPRDYDFLANRFERVIAYNLARGYRLDQFQLRRLMTGPDSLNETIIAVFRKDTA